PPPPHLPPFPTRRSSDLAVCVQVRKQIFVRRVPTHVTIELAIIWIARIAYDRTPDLLARLHVARKDGDAIRATHGRVDAVTRARDRKSTRLNSSHRTSSY